MSRPLACLAGLVLAAAGSGLLAGEKVPAAAPQAGMNGALMPQALDVLAPVAGGEDAGAVPASEPAARGAQPARPEPAPGPGQRHLAANLLEVHSGDDRHPAARSRAIQDQLSALGAQLAAGELATARGHLDQLQQLLPPRSLTLLRSRAWYALVAGDDAVARSLYGELAQRLPGDREATINLAIVEARLGEHDAAVQRLQRLLAATDQGRHDDGQALALLRSVHRLRESAALGLDTQVQP